MENGTSKNLDDEMKEESGVLDQIDASKDLKQWNGIERIDATKDRKQWKGMETFHKKATLEIARWVLLFFAIVLIFCCYVGSKALSQEGAMKYENVIELIRTMLGAILPLATLAVGYYLGEKGR